MTFLKYVATGIAAGAVAAGMATDILTSEPSTAAEKMVLYGKAFTYFIIPTAITSCFGCISAEYKNRLREAI